MSTRTKIFSETGIKFQQVYEEFEAENDVLEVRELVNPNSGYPFVWIRYKARAGKEVSCNKECNTCDSSCKPAQDVPVIGQEYEGGKIEGIYVKINLLKKDGSPGKVEKYIKVR